MSRSRLLAIGLIAAAVVECSSPEPLANELAQESAESNELIDAAKTRLEASKHDNSMLGRPLPPLPGVNIPAPETSNTSEPEHHHPEQ